MVKQGLYILTVAILFITGVANAQDDQNKKTPKNDIRHIIYLIGDAGHPKHDAIEVFELLKNQVRSEGAKSTVVFLGDNIYPGGMPDKDEKGREEAEKILDYQLEELKKLDIKLYYIPGNHDWNKGKMNGISHVRNEEKYIEKYMDEDNVFIPTKGCPGPVKIKIGKDILMYAIDTQWWMHPYEKPPIESADCIVSNKEEFIGELKDELINHKNKNIIVVGHHPIYSDGNHGGYFQFKDHLFPLTFLNDNLYIPIPLVGSIYPIYRSTYGHITDIIHPEYQQLIHGLEEAFEGIDGLVYAAGHEHTLQYYEKENQHFIVSGSGSETTYSSGKNGAEFSDSHKGLFKIIYKKDGSVDMQVWETDTSETGKLAFSKQIKEVDEEIVDELLAVDYKDEVFPESVIKAAGTEYAASPWKEFLWGKDYRAAWVAPVEFPVINLNTERGGLVPVEMGGRLQSKSLRVEASDGSQYVLRSLTKFPERALPENMQNTVAARIFKDQVSASHPYAAYVLPPMADAIKIFHTNPVKVFVPDSPNLLQFRSDFSNQLALYEQRAAHDLSDRDNFGNTTDAIKSSKLIAAMLADPDIVVEEHEVLRNRLFDMFIGDWDRHEDQWRWAEFSCDKENHDLCTHQEGIDKYYIPIPKDRDQAFAVFDGVFPTVTTRKWIAPRFQSFQYDIKNIEGVNFNARYVDRFFLTRLNREDWIAMAEELKVLLTDSIIDYSIKLWPDTIYKLDGEVVIAKLKSRRDKLTEFATRYYDFLSKEVEVLGSEQNEVFEITRLNSDSTLVTVYKLNKDNNRTVFYKRMFLTSETNEIRVYGLGGKDDFFVTGEVKKGILIRIIGGYGKDMIVDSSRVNGIRKLTKVYDTEKKTEIIKGKETVVHTSKQKSSNRYDRKSYKPNVLYPNAFFGFNPDDGLFIGGGVTYKKQGFRKDPFKATHRILGNIAFKTFSFNILYTGEYVDIFGKTDFRLDVLVNFPKLTNFFGYGNETTFNVNDDDRDYYVTRYDAITARGLFVFSNNKPATLRVGPHLQRIKTEQAPERFLTEEAGGSQIDTTMSRYAGLTLDYKYEIKNRKVLPSRGILFSLRGVFNQEISGKDFNNLKLRAKITLYVPIYHALTYVINLSGTTLFNEFEYYHSATLGGLNYTKDNDVLRGYRRDRFGGRSSFAWNNELRWKIFNFKTALFPGQFGISGFVDVGRVWYDDENSSIWHNNYGGGIWVSPMDVAVISAYYSISKEENMFRLIIGFLF